jgi:hypothetical protein
MSLFVLCGRPKTLGGIVMPDCRITCIRKPHPHSPHEHITHIGNPQANWILTREDAIRRIDNGTDSFYVLDPVTMKRADVGVVRAEGKAPYLRTHADGYYNDNLLSLGQCL